MKKLLAAVLTLGMFVTSFAVATPSEAKTIEIKIDGEVLQTDQPPIARQGRTLVPLRAIFEGLGAEVTWYPASNSIYCYRDGTSIDLTVNDRIGYIGGKRVTLDVPPMAINGRTLVPVRVVSEALGATCEWKASENLVDITSNDGYVGVMRVDYEALLPNNLKIVPQSYGSAFYLEGNFVNTTAYPILHYSVSYIDKKSGEDYYLATADTVLPGETSPKLDNFGPDSGRLEDVQLQKLNLKFKTPYGDFFAYYDCRLNEIEFMCKSSY